MEGKYQNKEAKISRFSNLIQGKMKRKFKNWKLNTFMKIGSFIAVVIL